MFTSNPNLKETGTNKKQQLPNYASHARGIKITLKYYTKFYTNQTIKLCQKHLRIFAMLS